MQSFAKSINMLIYTAVPMLFIFIKLSNQAVIQCEVETVGNCPNTSDSWNAAAQRKNCSTDLCGINSVYHCLLTEKGQLVEVCVNPINLHGVCPYYDTVGKSVQRSHMSCVSVDLTKNCTKLYSSANVYDYPVCYPSQGITDASVSGATRIHDDATRFWIIIFFFKIFESKQMNCVL